MHAIGLPDPVRHAGFYDHVPTKRGLAWGIDVVVITLLSLLLTPLTFFTSLFWFPLFYACVGVAYRTVTIARGSATWGMRAMSIELRDVEGERFDLPTAFWHTLGYTASVAMFPVQLISAAAMLVTPRGQGLSDLVLGSAAINRSATD